MVESFVRALRWSHTRQIVMTVKEQVVRELERLSEPDLRQIAEYMTFLKFRSRLPSPPSWDEERLAALAEEFAEEDRELAEQGMADYVAGLAEEDQG